MIPVNVNPDIRAKKTPSKNKGQRKVCTMMTLPEMTDESVAGTVAVDFRVVRMKDRAWEIMPVSKRATLWVKANFNERLAAEGLMHTDLLGVNSFLTKARRQGFFTEYCGPLAKAVF